MARIEIRLDHDGIGDMLKSYPVRSEIAKRASAIRAAVAAHESVQRHNMPVTVEHFTTDRASAAVTIAHAGGRGVEAKYGALTKAAGLVHLDVTEDSEAARARRTRRRKAREHRERLKTDDEYRSAYERRREEARQRRKERSE